jgi:hypothetical protein
MVEPTNAALVKKVPANSEPFVREPNRIPSTYGRRFIGFRLPRRTLMSLR